MKKPNSGQILAGRNKDGSAKNCEVHVTSLADLGQIMMGNCHGLGEPNKSVMGDTKSYLEKNKITSF